MSRFPDEARHIWETYVPDRGQADTVQGELLRVVEKLRWEAQENGNQNWDEHFDALVRFLEDTLLGSALFEDDALEELRADLARVRDVDRPETGDELYDRFEDRVVEWARAHPDPVPRPHDPTLRR